MSDDLFADSTVDLGVLQARAFNGRWAEQPPEVIPLTAADPDFPVAEEIVAAIERYLHPAHLSYGPPAGLPELRATAAESLNASRGLGCTPEQILVTDGAASALFLIARWIFREGTGAAVIPDPADFLLERSVVAAGGTARRLPLPRSDGYRWSAAALEERVTSDPAKLIAICNPHNPLGRVPSTAELEMIADTALRHRPWIVSDEVWSDIVYPPAVHRSIASLSPEVAQRTFSVFGFSKGYGLAGLRLGLIVCPTVAICEELTRLSGALDTAFGASTLSQVAGIAALTSAGPWREQFVTHLRRQRDMTIPRLNAIPGVTCAVPDATFVAFPDVSQISTDTASLVQRLRERHGVAVVPGTPAFFGPGAQGHIRLSFATSRAILSEGLDRLEAGLRAEAGHESTPQRVLQ